MQLNFRSTPPPRPRPDELDKLVCLIGEVKASLRQLQQATQLPATQEQEQEACNAKWTPA